jgi:hypothetical protein
MAKWLQSAPALVGVLTPQSRQGRLQGSDVDDRWTLPSWAWGWVCCDMGTMVRWEGGGGGLGK